MKLFFSALAVFFIIAHASAQTKPDILIFDEDDPIGAGYYDASYCNVTGSSVLTLGGDGSKLLITQAQHYTGISSGLIEWRSAPGGGWNAFIASAGWAARNAAGYDSLVFFVNSRAAIPAGQLPTLGLETSANAKSLLVNLGD